MTRQCLPNRRLAETFELEIAGLRYTCTVGRFNDGRLAEVFLGNHQSNSAADTSARDSAIVFSIAVQCGVNPDVIRRALSLTRSRVEPARHCARSHRCSRR
jgi:hypothetical protein